MSCLYSFISLVYTSPLSTLTPSSPTITENHNIEIGESEVEIDTNIENDGTNQCFVCENMYIPDNVCIECNEPFHETCAADLEISLCKLCGNKRAADTERRGCKRGLEEQADKMLVQSQNKFPPVNVGDNVLINIPEVDRGRLAPRNVLAVIMEKTDQGLFILGTKNGKLQRLYSRNEFQLSPSVFLSLSEIAADSSVSVRQEAMMSSGSRQGFTRCNCLKGCQTKA